MPVIMMSWSNPDREGLPCVLTQPDSPPVRMLKRITAYFTAEMRAGRIRRHDPEIVARAFLAGMHSYVFLETVHKANQEMPLSIETYLRGYIQLLWAGIEP